MSDATILPLIHTVTRGVELIGIALILIGAAYSGARYIQQAAGGAREGAYKALRSNLGRSILLGLELLVAADIINTVAVEPTLGSLAVLAGIVAIRTFLSFSLELEIEGKWPWQQARRTAEQSSADARARPAGEAVAPTDDAALPRRATPSTCTNRESLTSAERTLPPAEGCSEQ